MNYIMFENKKIYPSKVVCVGRNYVAHIKELGNEMPESMVLFNKPNSAIGNELFYFSDTHRFEGEISFLIKDAEIAGVGFGLDLTNKDAQEYAKQKGLPWERAKAFNNSAIFSHFISIKEHEIKDLKMELYINKKLQQFATIDLMIHKPKTILSEIKNFMKLEDNDIIMSGTPKGVGNYKVGDLFEVKLFLDKKEILNYEFTAKGARGQ